MYILFGQIEKKRHMVTQLKTTPVYISNQISFVFKV